MIVAIAPGLAEAEAALKSILAEGTSAKSPKKEPVQDE
jgi:hypothetical protein